MSKWRTFSEIAGANIAYNDRFAASDESQADGSRSAIITRAGGAIAFHKHTVSQAAHGFSVGEVVRLDGSGNFTEATADTAANALVVGLVTEVIGSDDFTFQQASHATGLTGLTAGSRHYLQDGGGLGTSKGTVEVPILDADATTSGWLVPLGAGGGGGGSSTESFLIACSDETTALTAGTAVVTFRMPYAFTLSAVRASVGTAPVGANIIVDINESGTTILSTKLSIDDGEKTSTTAATAAVISDADLADDAEISIDVDQIGSSTAGAGLKVALIGTQA